MKELETLILVRTERREGDNIIITLEGKPEPSSFPTRFGSTMKEPETVLRPGTRVRTHEVLGGTGGFMVVQRSLVTRKPNQDGTILGWVPGHGGDVYWVQHDTSGEVAAYGWPEFEVIP